MKLLSLALVFMMNGLHAMPKIPKTPKGCKPVLSLKADARFLADVSIPSENLNSRFSTYEPKNPSQAKALVLAEKIVNYEGDTSAGLVLSGPPGVGKSHLAISIARHAHARGQKVLFLTPETMFDFTRRGKEYIPQYGEVYKTVETHVALDEKGIDLVVIDDLNPDNVVRFTSYRSIFLDIFHWAHRTGGKRLVVTTNANPATLKSEILEGSKKSELSRYEDRYRTMFIEQKMTGSSQRKRATWADN